MTPVHLDFTRVFVAPGQSLFVESELIKALVVIGLESARHQRTDLLQTPGDVGFASDSSIQTGA